MKIIKQIDSYKAVGPYSLAVEKGGMMFCSGQIGIDADGKLVSGGIHEEFKVIMSNISDVLSQAGYKISDVVKVVVYVVDMYEYKKLNSLYEKSFHQPYPARATVEVSRLPLNASIEVEVTAIKE